MKQAKDMSVKELARYIDYSVLKPEFTEDEIIDLTKDGVKLHRLRFYAAMAKTLSVKLMWLRTLVGFAAANMMR